MSNTDIQRLDDRLRELEKVVAVSDQKLDDLSKKLDDMKKANDDRRGFFIKLISAPFAAAAIAWLLSGGLEIRK